MRRLGLVLLATAIACGSPARDAKQERETAASWAAAGAMLGEEWLAGHVTDGYARSTADVAAKEVPAQKRTWEALQRAVENEDRDGARKAVDDFRRLSSVRNPQASIPAPRGDGS